MAILNDGNNNEVQHTETCACGCGRTIEQMPGAHRKRHYYEDECRVIALRTRRRERQQIEARRRWRCFPSETQQLLDAIQVEHSLELANAVAGAVSREHEEGQTVMLQLLGPELEQLRAEVTVYRSIHDISSRSTLYEEWCAVSEKVGWRALINFGILGERKHWITFFDSNNEPDVAKALVAAQNFYDALKGLSSSSRPNVTRRK